MLGGNAKVTFEFDGGANLVFPATQENLDNGGVKAELIEPYETGETGAIVFVTIEPTTEIQG